MAYYEDIIEETSGVKCVLCDKIVPDNNHCIETHINEKDHRVKFINRLMIQNNIVVTETKIYCMMCKLEIGNLFDLTTHIQTSLHQNVMMSIRNIIEKDGALLELPENVTSHNNVHCSICDQNVIFTFEGIKEHIITTKHKRARSITVQPFNGIFSVEGSNDDLWCKICQIYFENYVELILQHVDDDVKHATSLGKILKLIEGQNITIENYLTNPREDKAFCNKCSIEVPCNLDNLERHIKGKKHNN